MSAEIPSDDDRIEAARRLRGLDDEELLARLSAMFGEQQAAPGWFADAARATYGLRLTDADLAEMTSDSLLEPAGAGLRADEGPRLVTFEAQDLSIEVEVQPGSHADRWRLIGQLDPTGSARIQLRRPQGGEPAWVDSDQRGRFVVDDLASGPLSLMCLRERHAAVTTAWITIG